MELSCALFAGQMEVSENLFIDPKYIEHCRKNLSVDLNTSAKDDDLVKSHLRLVARSLTQFHETNRKFTHFLGYSVGQFGALAACGAIEATSALDLVHERAKCLDDARKTSNSQLITVLGVPFEKVEEIVRNYTSKAFIGAYNSKMNVMLGFQSDIRDELVSRIRDLQPIKIIEPNGFGAWHTPFMTDAAKTFTSYLIQKFEFTPVDTVFIENIDARSINLSKISRGELIDNLITSIFSPVQFGKMIATMQTENVITGVEFGLTPFLSKLTPFINRSLKISFANSK